MRRAARRLLLLALAFALIVAAALAVRRPGHPSLYPAGGQAVVVYLVDNGFHSNLAVRRSDLLAAHGPTAAAAARTPPGPWIALGWGDRRFFTESGLSPARAADALRAAFAPGNRSVVMLEPLRDRPDRLWRDGVTPLRLSPEGFRRMLRRADASFLLLGGAPVPGPRGPAARARFFESVETFSVLRLCNHWTADLLHAAGAPTRPMLSLWGAGLAWDVRTGAAGLRPTS